MKKKFISLMLSIAFFTTMFQTLPASVKKVQAASDIVIMINPSNFVNMNQTVSKIDAEGYHLANNLSDRGSWNITSRAENTINNGHLYHNPASYPSGITSPADAYVTVIIPEDGIYYVHARMFDQYDNNIRGNLIGLEPYDLTTDDKSKFSFYGTKDNLTLTMPSDNADFNNRLGLLAPLPAGVVMQASTPIFYWDIGTEDHHVAYHLARGKYKLKLKSTRSFASSTVLNGNRIESIIITNKPTGVLPAFGSSDYGSAAYYAAYKDFAAPSVPGTPTVASKSANSVTLSWNPSTDNRGNVAYDIIDVDSNKTLQSAVFGNVYQVTGLMPETQYNLKIRAIDMVGNYSDSQVVNVTTDAIELPKPYWPSDAALSVSDVSAYALNLSWPAAVAGTGVIQSYKVYKNDSEVTTVAATTAANYTQTVSGLSAETTYHFKIVAIDSSGQTSSKYIGTEQKELTASGTTAEGKQAFFLTFNNFNSDRYGGWSKDSYQWTPQPDPGLPLNMLVRGNSANSAPATTDIYISKPGRYQISAYYKSHATTTSSRTFQVGFADGTNSFNYSNYTFANFSSAPTGVTGFFEGWDKGYSVELTAGKKTIGLNSSNNSGARCAAIVIYKLEDGETYDPSGKFAEQLSYQDFAAPQPFTVPPTATLIDNTAMKLNWQPTVDTGSKVRYYDVYKNDVLVDTVGANQNTYTFTNLEELEPYSFKVIAGDAYLNTTGETNASVARTCSIFNVLNPATDFIFTNESGTKLTSMPAAGQKVKAKAFLEKLKTGTQSGALAIGVYNSNNTLVDMEKLPFSVSENTGSIESDYVTVPLTGSGYKIRAFLFNGENSIYPLYKYKIELQ